MSTVWILLAVLACTMQGVQGSTSSRTCIISGTQIGCSVTFLGKDISATLKLHPCKSQPTASITLSAFGFHYSHTFSSEEDVPITGLYYGPIAKVYLKLSLKKNSFGEIHVKVDLAEKVMFIGGESINIIDENMGKCNQDISSGGNGFWAWVQGQPDGIKVAIYGGFAVLFFSVIACIYCCCRCCRKTPPPPIMMVQQQPNFDMDQMPPPVNNGMSYVKF